MFNKVLQYWSTPFDRVVMTGAIDSFTPSSSQIAHFTSTITFGSHISYITSVNNVQNHLIAKMTDSKVNVLMVGTGEYTTGYVGGTAADSDKGAGVVALTMFDLRRRSKVDRVAMCGVNVSTSICTEVSKHLLRQAWC
jgi:hypothetical protein